MNFIQKMLKIFALAADDKGLSIFFFKIPYVGKKIKQEMFKCFLNRVGDGLKYKMLDMGHCVILHNVLTR